MNDFENELRKALARREPSPDFVERVLARTAPARKPASFVFSWWRFASAAALIVVLFSAAFGYRQHIRREKGEAAKKQLMVALRIAGTELRDVQLHVKKIEKQEAVLQ
ncbi:MAG TPA: hypothetical protein VKX25_03240 [Bryobacteraceae bacterium]|jgi:hypothetical protein|nr:hypothetical protein [Bryobacteraceae bacterium]